MFGDLSDLLHQGGIHRITSRQQGVRLVELANPAIFIQYDAAGGLDQQPAGRDIPFVLRHERKRHVVQSRCNRCHFIRNGSGGDDVQARPFKHIPFTAFDLAAAG